MIFDAILTILSSFLSVPIGGLLDLLPEPPAWYFDAVSIFHDVIDLLYAFETYLPIDFAINVALYIIAIYLVTMLAEITRLVLSFVTLGGGAK